MVSADPDKGDQFPPEPVRRSRVPAGYAILVTLTTLLLVVFLDADGLTRTAERQHPGFGRSAALAVMRPIKSVSGALGLNRPRAWVAEASGNTQATKFSSTKGVKLAKRPSATTVPGATTTTTTLPTYRTPTPADPLRVLVAGDSLSGYLGPSLAKALEGLPAKVTPDEHVGTGLARPDVVDWPKELTEDMASDRPDVVVIFIGGNDDQDLRTPDGWIPITHFAQWKTEYQRRIAQAMDIVAKPGVSVYWIGLPAMGKAHLQQYVGTINSLIQIEAAARPHSVTYVDSGKALNGPDGNFVIALPDASGRNVTIRANDGVHPTMAGMDRIVALFAPELIQSRHLEGAPQKRTTSTTRPAKS